MKGSKSISVLALSGFLCGMPAYTEAQPNPTQQRLLSQQDEVPVFRVVVVGRAIPAINYRHRGGATRIDFRGTSLLPEARGEAKVESKQGYTEIEVEFDELEPSTRFGAEYLTYVMWAITPEGRATNLGEVLLNRMNDSKLNVTTELQAFGLIVTAEPYFAVSQPSDVVVMENFVRRDTRGNVEVIEANYELLKRGTYLMNTDPVRFAAENEDEDDDDTPLELLEARNAVRLSRLAGADEYASTSFAKASRLLEEAEDQNQRRGRRREMAMAAREAAQTAEDARLIALQRQEEEQLTRARLASAEREADALARARLEGQRRQQAEADRLAAERAAAERRRLDSEKAGEDAARARAEAERVRADAELARQRLTQEKAAIEAEQARLRAEADAARLAREEAEREKAELRARLEQQLNIILDTRETARGLIVNMSDVLFDTGQATLKSGAREKLAKVAGVVLTYPGLTLEVEGHTDSVGTDEYNGRLSERRAETVRDYFVQQGVPSGSIVARGYGESRPFVSNDTAAGRQQNRRVELVVSGELIGSPTPTTTELRTTPRGRGRE